MSRKIIKQHSYNIQVFPVITSIMRLSATSVFLALAYASTSVLAGIYAQTSNIVGADFLSAFTFEAITDPTSGFV